MVAVLKRTALVSSAAALFVCAGAALAQAVVFTENFNDATAGAQQSTVPTSERWETTFYYGSPVVDSNWIFSDSVFLAREIVLNVPTGDQAIQLNEQPGHALAVRVPGVSPIIGETHYTLQFDHWGDNFEGTYTFLVKADATVVHTVTRDFLFSGSGTTESFSFMAPSNSFVLSFLDATPTGSISSALIDNMVLTAIPEPETYAMLFAGLGLLGFVARRRKAALRAFA
jgi:hypothetical protein